MNSQNADSFYGCDAEAVEAAAAAAGVDVDEFKRRVMENSAGNVVSSRGLQIISSRARSTVNKDARDGKIATIRRDHRSKRPTYTYTPTAVITYLAELHRDGHGITNRKGEQTE